MKLSVEPLQKVSFTVKETAVKMGTGVNTIYALIEAGELRCMKMPTKLIPGFEIERFLRKTLEEGTDYTNILKRRSE